MGAVAIDADVFVSQVYKLLAPDATLQGATYLTASGRVHKHRRPKGALNPCVIVNATVTTDSDGGRLSEAVGTVLAFATNIAEDSPDAARLGRVIKRCWEVIETAPITSGGIVICTLKVVGSQVGLFDTASPEEHYGWLRFRAIFRNP